MTNTDSNRFAFSPKSLSLPLHLRALSVLAGFVVVAIVLYFAHLHVPFDPEAALHTTHPAAGATDPFDPFKCQAPPSDCWDGYMKQGGLKCVTFSKPTYLRGKQVLAPPDAHTCYKSVYFNMERTTGTLALLFIIWASLVRAAVERVCAAVFQRSVNRVLVLALLVNLVTLWYSFSVMIHYLNDGYYAFFWSQMYFWLSDTYVFTVAIAAVHSVKAARLPRVLIFVSLTFSAYHMLQIVLDEAGQTQWMRILRNLGLFACDFLMFVGLFMVPQVRAWFTQAKRQFLILMAAGVVANLIVFQLFFADEASFHVGT